MQTKILAVDDEKDYLELLSLNLEIEGYRVNTANGRESALASVAADRPDIILMDVKMGEDNGLEITAELKGNNETRNIPIIMLTGEGSDEDKAAGFEAGADDYVVKPYTIDHLLSRIAIVLAEAAVSCEG